MMTAHELIVVARLLVGLLVGLGFVYVVLMCVEHFIEEVLL
jgi:hypothetical protein